MIFQRYYNYFVSQASTMKNGCQCKIFILFALRIVVHSIFTQLDQQATVPITDQLKQALQSEGKWKVGHQDAPEFLYTLLQDTSFSKNPQ